MAEIHQQRPFVACKGQNNRQCRSMAVRTAAHNAGDSRRELLVGGEPLNSSKLTDWYRDIDGFCCSLEVCLLDIVQQSRELLDVPCHAWQEMGLILILSFFNDLTWLLSYWNVSFLSYVSKASRSRDCAWIGGIVKWCKILEEITGDSHWQLQASDFWAMCFVVRSCLARFCLLYPFQQQRHNSSSSSSSSSSSGVGSNTAFKVRLTVENHSCVNRQDLCGMHHKTISVRKDTRQNIQGRHITSGSSDLRWRSDVLAC